MEYLILSGHSSINEPIARLTAQNKWDYSVRHGYDLLTLRVPWEIWKRKCLKYVLDLLPHYKGILAIGSDVLFMNHLVRIEDNITSSDNIVLARECSGKPEDGWSQINNDVVIWMNTDKTRMVLQRLISDMPKWINGPQLWQSHFQKLLIGEKSESEIMEAVRLVEPRVMNSNVEEGPQKISKWEMGDWIFHALCGPNERKFILLKHYLEMVSD